MLCFRPDEFLKYTVDYIRDARNPNSHWELVSLSCPFCGMNFTVISKLEEMSEDTIYIMNKANLWPFISNPNFRMNPSNNSNDKTNGEHSFWANVTDEVILQCFNTYRLDFDMFDYSPVKYFESLGLPEKSQLFKSMDLVSFV